MSQTGKSQVGKCPGWEKLVPEKVWPGKVRLEIVTAGKCYTGKCLIRQLLDRKWLDRRSATGKKSPRISLWLWNFRGNTYRDVRTENEKVD